jgi:hypothetical protein
MTSAIRYPMDIANAALVIVVVISYVGSLKPSGYFFIHSFLASTLINFLIVRVGPRSSKSPWTLYCWLIQLRIDWDLHVIQSVCFYCFIIEPGTIAGFPL